MSTGLSTRLVQICARTAEVLGPAPEASDAARACRVLRRSGNAVTLSYFPAWDGVAAGIIEACAKLSAEMAGQSPGTCLSIKAPPLYFDKDNLRAVAAPASEVGMTIVFDALTQVQAEQTLDLVEWMAGEFPSVGVVLPARWRRSADDARRFRDSPVRIRVVKGEWADPGGDVPDFEAGYLDLIRILAGRNAPVAVATHHPPLAAQALPVLQQAGTPCELEQLRGLPARRTRRIAQELGVPVRVFLPFGPGWWPYAAVKLVERPYLPMWWLKDRLA
ncbi:proline dehydrogenase family protein [Novosphingobium album (ex Hu et al. 2023)]|uniref:Proline dehydrogenase family protein n=1 Tax=Novosphingobium album (ex Hu et al. 2023) TaxID=2930093 RepID=A0ABT0B2F2_9SPHN|nr:proline dehydrogenase family protein [Novosphingobium album (ex Hu et al. 2023)]MCJ2178979.1 proline dehydrogenase family protein [Novosphingobium album (ex Hu et al. 2023)]